MAAVSGGQDAELRALLVLDALPGVGPATLRRLVGAFGSATAALAAPPDAFTRAAGARDATRARGSAEVGRAVDRALERAGKLGMRVLTWTTPGYPEALTHLPDPPPVLFLRGHAPLPERPAVTIVGARRATIRARDLAERLGHCLAHAGVTVVSGLALGVDGAAHRGALSGTGDTIAVLGTGADVPYPRAHARLFQQLLERGLVLTEFPPGTPALPHNFPRRNRILAALGAATVVVEAGRRSGSLITVDHALDLGRDVWAVPGPIERATCVGSNRLLTEGARPLLSVDDFVASVAPVAPEPAAPARMAGPEGLVLAALAAEPLSGDEVAERLDLPVRDVLAVLTALELRGAVRRLPGMRFGWAA